MSAPMMPQVRRLAADRDFTLAKSGNRGCWKLRGPSGELAIAVDGSTVFQLPEARSYLVGIAANSEAIPLARFALRSTGSDTFIVLADGQEVGSIERVPASERVPKPWEWCFTRSGEKRSGTGDSLETGMVQLRAAWET